MVSTFNIGRAVREAEEKEYREGIDCEFKLDGKLRGGKIVGETKDGYEVVCHSPNYRKIELPKNEVIILPVRI